MVPLRTQEFEITEEELGDGGATEPAPDLGSTGQPPPRIIDSPRVSSRGERRPASRPSRSVGRGLLFSLISRRPSLPETIAASRVLALGGLAAVALLALTIASQGSDESDLEDQIAARGIADRPAERSPSSATGGKPRAAAERSEREIGPRAPAGPPERAARREADRQTGRPDDGSSDRASGHDPTAAQSASVAPPAPAEPAPAAPVAPTPVAPEPTPAPEPAPAATTSSSTSNEFGFER